VNVASCDGSGELHTCAGRCGYRGLNGGLLTAEEERNLGFYLNPSLLPIYNMTLGIQGRLPGLTGRGHPRPLTPRLVLGSQSDERYRGKIVFGEQCDGIRHFDCIGFINFVFNKISKTRNSDPRFDHWSGDIGQWFDATVHKDWYPFTEVVPKDAPAVPADILFRGDPKNGRLSEKDWDTVDRTAVDWKHIALLGEDGSVVQAERSAMGVHDDERYNPQNWVARRRLKDQFFD
jgi:hypothetical protein